MLLSGRSEPAAERTECSVVSFVARSLAYDGSLSSLIIIDSSEKANVAVCLPESTGTGAFEEEIASGMLEGQVSTTESLEDAGRVQLTQVMNSRLMSEQTETTPDQNLDD